ncbi:MAG: anti-sigma factor [Chloroflexi bacterium]|nr:anti-sigma factor [Chloroflexota bacterium]MCI0579934.1 anti-sigma factor [Chloroflexota bacterium]MCI0646517.1 anti-sigma factor [Chloroflexota bacterium]MCI0726131.1 anti-sigma factor [Chloroflexota bacterium]
MKTVKSGTVVLWWLLLLGLILALPGQQAAAGSSPDVLVLDFKGLEDLGDGWVYEGWLIVNGAPVSTGTFTIDGNGHPSQTHFPTTADRDDVSAFVLTIEPSPDPDPAPSQVHVLGGDFHGRASRLTVGHPAALGNDFRQAGGSFILAVPSDASGNTPYTNGIWWLDPAAGPGPSLNLPPLPAGWVYEGWVVGPNGPISTGTFTSASGADSDGGGPYAGPDPTPPFPGQDFVNPPMDLTDLAAVISIEPSPDNSPAPFAFKPLVDGNIEDLGAPGLSQPMANNAAHLPTGQARLLPDNS